MTKKIITFAASWVFITLVFYVAGSVAGASTNIGKWNETTRGVIACFWLLASIVSTFVIFIDPENKN